MRLGRKVEVGNLSVAGREWRFVSLRREKMSRETWAFFSSLRGAKEVNNRVAGRDIEITESPIEWFESRVENLRVA